MTISFSMKACGVLLQPPRLPTYTMRAVGRGKGDDLLADQVVDQQHRRGLDGLDGFQGEQFRVAGTRAYESDFSMHS